MRSFSMQPSRENITSSLKSNLLDRNKDVFRFASMLTYVDGPMSIAIDGRWGSGKTFFVKQAQAVLEMHNTNINSNKQWLAEEKDALLANCKENLLRELESNPQIPVYFDAWENDDSQEPVLSIVYEIVKYLGNECELGGANEIKILDAAASVADLFTDKKASELIKLLKKNDLLEEVKRQKSVKETVTEFLETALAERGNRMVIFVDELDRCKPSFAIKLLERIKHYFECECVTFVFSVNIEELQHTVKQYYGSDFNADLYLSRFFDLQISLPPAAMRALFAEMKLTNSNYAFEKTCLAVIKYLDFQLRDIQQFYAFAKKTAYKATHPSSSLYTYGGCEEALRFCLDFFLPVLVGVRLHSPTSYREMIDGKNSTELIDILCSSSGLFYALSSRLNIKRANDNRYGESKEGHARLKEILNQIYEVVFVTPSQTEKEICDMYFSVQTRNDLLRISSLLSATADFSI